mgnify:FL=1
MFYNIKNRKGKHKQPSKIETSNRSSTFPLQEKLLNPMRGLPIQKEGFD